MKNEDFEEKQSENGEYRDYGPLGDSERDDGEKNDVPDDESEEEDVSMYYPDGDSEHMADDDEGDSSFLSAREKKKKKIRKKNARLTGAQIALIAVVFVLYTVVIVTASWILFYKPSVVKSGEDLPFDITPATNEGEGAPPVHRDDSTADKSGEETPDPDGTGTGASPIDEPSPDDAEEQVETPTSSGEWKVKDGVYNVLVVGMDKQANLADVTMLVNVNTPEGSVTVMQIPRDTLITTGVSTDKINAQYASLVGNAYHQGYSNSYMKALSDYARILEQSLCVKIHYTVLVDLEGFPAIVNSVGPISVFVPGPMHYSDPEQDLYIDIKEGWNELDGKAAEGFVRFRSGYVQADLGRMNAQKIFLTALYQKVASLLKNMEIGKITELAQVVSNNVTTDMSVSDLVFFARVFMNIGIDNVTMMTAPGDMATATHYVLNRAATLQIINDHFNIYEKAIDDNIFDRYWTFCYNYDVYLKVYYAPATSAYTSEYTGDEVAEDGIAIPFLH